MGTTDKPDKLHPRRLQHVVAHVVEPDAAARVTLRSDQAFDEVLVFGQEIDALRHTHGKTGWVYAAVKHGQSFVEALKAASS